MEKDHDANTKYDENDPNFPPLTKWECIIANNDPLSLFPLTTGHRGLVLNNNLIIFGGFNGVYSNATYKLNLGKQPD